MNGNPTIFVVDDEQQARESVCTLVRSMGLAAISFSSGEEFLQHYDNEPGCLVSDYRMAGMNGLELQESMLRREIALPMIIVTAYARTPIIVTAIRRGAVSLLDKPYDDDDLWQAIRSALSQDTAQRKERLQHADIRRRLAKLTDKESRVLDMLLEGMPNKTMANKLDVSLRTIENRRRGVFAKMGVETVAKLVALVLAASDRSSLLAEDRE